MTQVLPSCNLPGTPGEACRGTFSRMNKLLHSLPWTLALAMAQAGEGIPAPIPDSSDALQATESSLFNDEGGASPQIMRLSDSDPTTQTGVTG